MEPLAERLRPKTFDQFFGQKHLVGENGILRKLIESNILNSLILWGPPGTGKTTLAKLIATQTQRPFYTLSAVSSGVKEVREIIDWAKNKNIFNTKAPILFIDEIHRFSKSQQDALLEAVEKGIIILIGATTENPSFEIIPPLLSRCTVYILEPLSNEDLDKILINALENDEFLKTKKILIPDKDYLFNLCGGDARKLLNIIETIVGVINLPEIVITKEIIVEVLQNRILKYDKKGEYHYDIISAFIKSVRGSDPDAAIYWLARMLDSGEDIEFIGRRLIILAAEDIGLANPNALLLAQACFDAIKNVGMPEARIILAETTIYLASSPKSNSAYLSIDKALAKVKETGEQPVPLHLRNAPTKLMKDLNYGSDYKYPHDFDNNFVKQDYLPEKLKNERFYFPQNNQHEQKLFNYLKNLWDDRFL